jgi:uncharacterized Rmd1/YagE family protein
VNSNSSNNNSSSGNDKINSSNSKQSYYDTLNEQHGHCFIFRSGAVVLWGLRLAQRMEILRQIEEYALPPPSPDAGLSQSPSSSVLTCDYSDFQHEFFFTVGSAGSSCFRNDVVELVAEDFQNPLKLLSVSYGLAKSVDLVIYEESISYIVENTKKLPTTMAQTGKIPIKSEPMRRLMGQLLQNIYAVKVLGRFEETPELFWKNRELEPLFEQVTKDLDVKKRLRILHTQLDFIKECMDIIRNEQTTLASHNVEKLITALIAIEVALAIFK